MEKSPEYIQALEKVRSEKSKESAELFRMECLLDNAKLAMMLTGYLEENPTASAEEFIKYAQENGKIIHPDVTEAFIRNLAKARDLVNSTIKDKELAKDASERGLTIEEQLYQYTLPLRMQRSGVYPKGKISIDTSYPLALIMFVPDASDFEKIDENKNIGGFYKQHRIYQQQFPFIAVKGVAVKDKELYGRQEKIESKEILKHEEGHAENKVFIDALKKAERKTIWSEWRSNKLQEGEAEIESERIKNSENYKLILHSALSQAKNELLAELKSNPGNLDLGKLLERGGIYDYFDDYCADEFSYNLLWQDYEKILRQSVSAAQDIIKNYFILPRKLWRRLDLFRWVLAQIPIQDWPRQLERSQFIKEAERIKEVALSIENIFHDARTDNSLSPKAKRANEYLNLFLENQDKPLFEILDRFSLEIKQ